MVDLEQAGRRLSLTQVAPTPPVSKLEIMRAHRARHRRRALGASAVAVIGLTAGLAAWISHGTTRTARVTTAPPSAPSQSAAAVVKAAVAATKAAGSAQFYEADTSSQPASTVTSVGSVNFATNEWTGTSYNGTPGPQNETGQFRVIGSTTYEMPVPPNAPSLPPQWFKTSGQVGIAAWVFLPPTNPHLSASYTGTSDVQGAMVQEYDVHIPAFTLDGKPVAAYDIQVWLDGQGRIRQAISTRPAGGHTGTTTQTLRLSNIGVPVTVTVPSPVVPTP